MSQELDRGKPLWEHWFVDCVEGDRFALISKVHHCLADGIAGLAIIGTLVSPDSDARIETPPDWVPRPAPSGSGLVLDEFRHRSRLQMGLLGTPLRRWGAGSSGSLPSLASWSALRESRDSSLVGTPSPLNVPIGPHRRFDWIRLPFDDVHDIASKAGGKVNDVALALTTSALRAFLAERGTAIEGLDLRAMVPVNTRSAANSSTMGNSVSNLIVPLPIDEPDPWKRLQRIIATTCELKASTRTSIVDEMTQLVELLPRPLLGPVLRLGSQNTAANLAVGNVPGPRIPLYLLGACQLEMYPVLPLIGNQALGIALMSYDDALGWGFNADWDVLPDLHDLVERVGVDHDELRTLAKKRRAKKT